MLTTIKLSTPLGEMENLKSGDRVLLSGTIFTARDAAHKKLLKLLDEGKSLPIDLNGSVIFYAGPTPPPEGRPVGSIGPTTASRMDLFAIPLMEKLGIKATIGKGGRSEDFRRACKTFKGVYFAAIGGIAALLHSHVLSSEVVAFGELGPEAIRKMEVRDFPLVVANDTRGGDIFEESRKQHGIPLEEILKNL